MSETPKLKMTDFQLTKATEESTAKAYGTIVFNDAIKVNGIKVVQGKEAPFVSWPARKIGDKWVPYITFTSDANEMYQKLSAWIIKQYEEGNFTEKKPYVPKSAPKSKPAASQPSLAPSEDDDLPF